MEHKYTELNSVLSTKLLISKGELQSLLLDLLKTSRSSISIDVLFISNVYRVLPSIRKADTEPVRYDSVDYDGVLKGIRERYANDDRHQQRMLYI